MRGVSKSIKLAAAVLVTVTLLTDYQTVAGESTDNPIIFEPIPESTAKGQQVSYCPISRTHDVDVFTEEEKDLLKAIAMAEAGNQGEDGMFLVMSVVLNRVCMDPWPDTIKDVILQDHQFTSIDRRIESSEECDKALERIRSGDVAPKIIAFETKDSKVLDEYFWPAFTYKDHKFYTKK